MHDETIVLVTKEIKRLIGNRGIFGCTFIKKDGSIRTGSFRLGVKKNLTGIGQAYNPEESCNLIVYDMNKRGYRTIPLDRVISFTINGNKIGGTAHAMRS